MFFYCTFTDFHTHCQKLSFILENNMYQKLKLSKNVNNQKCSPKLTILNQNNLKDSNDFWCWKVFKVGFKHFLITRVQVKWKKKCVVLIFFQKSTPSWYLSRKLHHYGHANTGFSSVWTEQKFKNSKFHKFFLEVQNTPSSFLNLRHL